MQQREDIEQSISRGLSVRADDNIYNIMLSGTYTSNNLLYKALKNDLINAWDIAHYCIKINADKHIQLGMCLNKLGHLVNQPKIIKNSSGQIMKFYLSDVLFKYQSSNIARYSAYYLMMYSVSDNNLLYSSSELMKPQVFDARGQLLLWIYTNARWLQNSGGMNFNRVISKVNPSKIPLLSDEYWFNRITCYSIISINIDLFKRGGTQLSYPLVNQLLVVMKQVTPRKVVSFQDLFDMLEYINPIFDNYQMRIIYEIIGQLLPECMNRSEEFTMQMFRTLRESRDSSRVISQLCSRESSLINSVELSNQKKVGNCDNSAIKLIENGVSYCFSENELRDLIINKINPHTKTPFDNEFIERLKNIITSNNKNKKSLLDDYLVYHEIDLNKYDRNTLNKIVATIFKTEKIIDIDKLTDEHARITFSWIDEWCRQNNKIDLSKQMSSLLH